MDIETLALAKKYTKDTAVGLGAVKGAPCTISSVEDVDTGKQVTFSWTGTDGSKKTQKIIIPKGEAGESPTISSKTDDDGNTVLVVENTDGTSQEITIATKEDTFSDTSVGTTIGGFTAGEKVENLTLQEAFYKLLHPYTKPSASLTLNPSTTVYDVNDTVSSITLTGKATKGTKALTAESFSFDGTTIYTPKNVVESLTYKYTSEITGTNGKTHTFKFTVSDGTSTVEATKTITFIGKTYYGIVDATVGEPTADQVQTLKNTLKTSKGYSYSGITTDYGKVVYAYPSSLGALSSIKDTINNYDYTKSFTRTVITIDNIEYYCYTQTDPSAANNVTLVFA